MHCNACKGRWYLQGMSAGSGISEVGEQLGCLQHDSGILFPGAFGCHIPLLAFTCEIAGSQVEVTRKHP
eukprot:scaffold194371_cov18-Tisochrysis_lutea.AAC.2